MKQEKHRDGDIINLFCDVILECNQPQHYDRLPNTVAGRPVGNEGRGGGAFVGHPHRYLIGLRSTP